jgi:hypothetical protein
MYALETVLQSSQTLIAAAAVFVFADLLIALVHHLMDRYGDPSCWMRPFGDIFAANRRHHARPTDLLRHGPLANAAETIPIALGILALAWLFDLLTWHVVMFATAVAYSAVYHRLQHLPREQVCALVRMLQRMKILQDRRQHYEHHVRHDVNYAVLTNVANWLLEKTGALRRLERLIDACCDRIPFDLKKISRDARRK